MKDNEKFTTAISNEEHLVRVKETYDKYAKRRFPEIYDI